MLTKLFVSLCIFLFCSFLFMMSFNVAIADYFKLVRIGYFQSIMWLLLVSVVSYVVSSYFEKESKDGEQ